MLTSKLPEYLEELFNTLSEQSEERVTIVGGKALEKNLKKRIFNEGKATNDVLIRGKYSKIPNYYEKDQFVVKGAFKPIGKNDTTKISTKTSKSGVEKDTIKVTKRKDKNVSSMYLAGGYEQFRRIQGRQVNFVDLNLSGSLLGNIQLVRDDGKTLLVITDNTEIEKSERLEKMYKKKIFEPSRTDTQKSEQAMIDEIAKIFNEILT